MTDKEDTPKRPNAKYNLTRGESGKDPYGDDNLVFYYNREHRLEKAPQRVKDIYAANKPGGKPSLFKSLAGDKPRFMLFFAILIMCAMIYSLSFLGMLDSSYSLDGNRVEILGTIYEDSTIVVLKKNIGKNGKNSYTGAVDIAISPVESIKSEIVDFPVFYHRVFFTLEPLEEYRFAVPFASQELLMVLQTETKSANVRFKPR
jgi:hypothetical protein